MIDLNLLDEYGWRLVLGLTMTLKVVGCACALGFLIAYPLALARRSRKFVLWGPALALITCFRGTPLLCQIYLVYYGAGELRPFLTSVDLWWFFKEAYYCCILTFALNTGCYQAEIIRGALASVPHGQLDAARALGMSPYRMARHVVWPQALLMLLRPMGNELISMVKASAIAAVVTLLDLMGQTRLIYSRTFDFSIYLYAAALYLVVTGLISRAILGLERRLSSHSRARGEAPAQATEPRAARSLLRGGALAQPH